MALSLLSPQPLNAEDIAETLSVARSNVSNSLRELQGWGLVKVVHVLGDRRDHFETMTDVWSMFEIILDERKRREIDPTLHMLRELKADTAGATGRGAYTAQRVEEMLGFVETMTQWYAGMRKLPPAALRKFFTMGAKLRKALGVES